MVLSYAGLVLVNNSGYQLENMWVLYAPMFIGVYIFSRWIDSKLITQGWRTNNSHQVSLSSAHSCLSGPYKIQYKQAG